jgi:hypothetical protein
MRWQKIWEHGFNANLKRKRVTPNILMPGDPLYIPDKVTRSEECQTGRLHPFKVPGRAKIVVVLKDSSGNPLRDIDYTFVVDGCSRAPIGQTQMVAQELGPTPTRALLF